MVDLYELQVNQWKEDKEKNLLVDQAEQLKIHTALFNNV